MLTRWIPTSFVPFVAVVSVVVFPSCSGGTQPLEPGDDNPVAPPGSADLTVTVGADVEHQEIEGFGATISSLVFDGGNQDNVPPSLRPRMIEAAFGEVGVTMGNLQVGGFEQSNDDDDPFTISWENLDPWRVRVIKEKVVDPARSHGFDNGYPGLAINVRWNSRWLKDIRRTDYDRYLDECAEWVLVGLREWRDRFGALPPYLMLHNEPLSGGRLLDGGSVQEVVDIVKRVGRRLADEGMGSVKFVVPAEETEELSLSTARAIVSDSEARSYVGALTYHPYPYGSTYSSVRNILDSSGSGSPDPDEIQVRRDLSELGRSHGLPVWMTEVSNGQIDPRSMDHVRGRAIHIHDEFVYADASAFYAMSAFWDSRSHFEHFGNRNLLDEEDTIVLVDNDAEEVLITGMGYAIGHYARWLERGARRLEASSPDPLILATAYRDDAERTFTAVLINNRSETRVVELEVSGLDLDGPVVGERSHGDLRWERMNPVRTVDSGTLRVSVPAQSVTTVQTRF